MISVNVVSGTASTSPIACCDSLVLTLARAALVPLVILVINVNNYINSQLVSFQIYNIVVYSTLATTEAYNE